MPEQDLHITDPTPASGGWGSLEGVATILGREGHALSTAALLRKQNKHDGYMCVSCAWAKPEPPHLAEFCENGAKATAWDLTSHRIAPEFFASHTVAELEGWTDHALEQAGRLTEPMRWDAATDRYVPTSWDEAFAGIGGALRGFDPKEVVFYASGRASNEAAFLWQLFARAYGTNNLPDSSNMCHESTSVALPEAIGVPVGTTTLEDFSHTGCILIFGQNTAVNSPRMLHQLEDAVKRGVPIIVFNPLREHGIERFTNPQSPSRMLVTQSRQIAAQFLQPLPGGDLAAMTGLCKLLLEWDAAGEAVLDDHFIAEETHGFQAFAASMRRFPWPEIEARSGLSRAALEQVARTYVAADSAMGVYGMGLTQHRQGVEAVRMLTNLLLLRGNIGKPGGGICPVRGHSNVQGQRAVWITEKPELAPLDRFKALFAFEPPRGKGLDSVEAAKGVIEGKVKAVLQLGGNLTRSLPERGLLEPAWRRLPLTVMITTKLNRSHLVHGRSAWLLPCLSRIEIDRQASGPQIVSMEDSTSGIHPSHGQREPASPHLLSEPAIIAGLAKATLPPNPKLDWGGWVDDYTRIRHAIAECHPEWFSDYDARMRRPGGFVRSNPARKREWRTETKKANFLALESLEMDPDMPLEDGPGTFRLMTVRSNDQFNTTIYGYEDRFRGVHGSRDIVFLNPADIEALGLTAGQSVALETVAKDGVERRVGGLQVVPFDLPRGSAAAYYPECNPLLPLWHHAKGSHVPAAKSIPVRLHPEG
ncbi:FdhF/YdeP family oxidoreductase [Siccirubricoccus phaeus]|uniref:FdhF/YdeP family oxidoreductase n=1 Tax=Siccirubricoccus phaeus TaxID=2595053 RepID=UPI0011F18860|nr:FdhF/YdeP family oxidoreductase [Siccirubricoccus phaeus]